MFTALVANLKQRLQRWNKFQVSLHSKVIIANHLVASVLWYVLTLVAFNFKKLHKLQQLLVAFVWGKTDRRTCHRVLEHIVTLPKHLGGLGLIDVTLQAKALCLRVLLWAFDPGFHPLQRQLRHEAARSLEARHAYGSLIVILEARRTSNPTASPVVSNMFCSWDFFKAQLTLQELSLSQFWVADIWGDSQVIVSGQPLALTSML